MLAKPAARRYGFAMSVQYLDTPVGRLALEADDETLTAIRWAAPGERAARPAASKLLAETARQLDRYFQGKLKRFDLPITQHGTELQRQTWVAMQSIPFGETATYGGLARQLGSGPRAVGTACARNRIPIVVPCHRILASGSREGGYSGGRGLPTKRQLLAHEGVVLL